MKFLHPTRTTVLPKLYKPSVVLQKQFFNINHATSTLFQNKERAGGQSGLLRNDD